MVLLALLLTTLGVGSHGAEPAPSPQPAGEAGSFSDDEQPAQDVAPAGFQALV